MAAAVVVSVVLLLVLARVLLGYPRPERFYEHLAPREVAFLRAAGDAIFPPGGRPPHSGTQAGVPEYVDRYLHALPGSKRLLIRLLFALMEHATLLVPLRAWNGWRRFTALRPEQQRAWLEGWDRSRLFPRRLVMTSLRAVITMAYVGAPPVRRALGLAPLAIPPVVHEADLLYPRIGAPRSSIRWRPEDVGPPSDAAPLDPHGPIDPAWAEEAP